MNLKRGGVLPLICASVLISTLLSLSSLFFLGSGKKLLFREVARRQELYEAEAEVLHRMFRVPKNFQSKKMKTAVYDYGIWDEVCGEFSQGAYCALYGVRAHNLSAGNFFRPLEEYGERIYRLENSFRFDTLYGNRRFFEIPEGCSFVSSGDVSINVNASGGFLCIKSDGDLTLRGEGVLDSALLISNGEMRLSGNLHVRRLLSYSGSSFNASGIRFLGEVVGAQIHLSGRLRADYPSVATCAQNFFKTDDENRESEKRNKTTYAKEKISGEFIVAPDVRFDGILWNACGAETTHFSSSKVKALRLGFPQEEILDIPLPGIFSNHLGEPLPILWRLKRKL